MKVTIFNPLFWITIVFGIYLLINNRVWKKRLKYFTVLLLFIATNNWVSTLALNLWEYKTITVDNISEPYDIGIVLGPYLNIGKNLPVRSETTRFTQAIQLYKLNKFKKFLLSGNDNSTLTRRYLIDLGVPPEDILVEGKSNNTYENAVLSNRFLRERDSSQKLLLITSAYHISRANKCFEKVGLKVTPFSVDYKTSCFGICKPSLSDIIPNRRALERWELLLSESASTIVFRLKNYI